MSTLIETSTPETATGVIKDGYDIFKKRGLDLPDPLRLISASPGYFKIMMDRNGYYSSHPRLSFGLLANIRYFAASKLGYGFCTLFNKEMLIKMGVSEDDFEQMKGRPDKALLEEKEIAMLTFVTKAVDDPDAISKADIESVRQHDWHDSDLLDAVAQAVGMHDHFMFMKIFKPDF